MDRGRNGRKDRGNSFAAARQLVAPTDTNNKITKEKEREVKLEDGEVRWREAKGKR